MEITVDIREAQAIIALSGRFDFSTHTEFSSSYVTAIAHPGVKEIQVDLDKVEYLDSSALGMLLLLGERAKLANKAVALARPNDVVAQVLERVSFGRLFNIKK